MQEVSFSFTFFLTLIMGLLAYLDIPAEQIAFLCLLMLVDMFTGVAASRKHGTYKSKRVREGFNEKGLQLIIIFSAAITYKALDLGESKVIDVSILVSGVLSILIFAEFVSIVGNWQKYRSEEGVKTIKLDVYSLFVEKLLKPIAKHFLKGKADDEDNK